ncbi:EF-hand domain-containing protein [Geminicoccaceae bacterium 1502E]|nr:EF-hand domain-containing protein [Geminicoccaceae bacterium 1502E]
MLQQVSRRLRATLSVLVSLAGCAVPEAGRDALEALPAAAAPLPAGTALLADAIEAGRWQAETARLFRVLDADEDGLLTLEEIKVGMDLLDADGDGWITSREVRGLLVEDVLPYRLQVEDMARLACACFTADLDGDGALSAIEFSVSRLREFVLHDLNRDGVLQAQEIEEAVDLPLVRF